MILDSKSTRALDYLSSQMITMNKSAKIRLAIVVIIVLGGLYGLVVQIVEGHIVTSSTMENAYHTYCRNYYGDLNAYWSGIYFIMHGTFGSITPLATLWKNSVSNNLGCSGH